MSIWPARRKSASSAVDRRADRGPFDIIGDLHGCADELDDLCQSLGYTRESDDWTPCEGRKAIFVGDLVDRGPDNVGTLRRVMSMVARGHALAVPGNHDVQLQHWLEGEPTPLVYGLDGTAAELTAESPAFQRDVLAFLQRLPSHYVLDGGALVVAHTGLPEALHGRESAHTREIAAYGVPAGEIDPGDPAKRHAWIASYRGTAAVVYGHTPVLEPVWRGHTIDIDTGCVYGVRLTALRWPARTLISVPARRAYAPPTRHFPPGRKPRG